MQLNKVKQVNSLNNAIEQGEAGEQAEMTLEQAKAEVLKLVDSGLGYREISERTFNVNGAKRHFSIGWISGLVKDRDNPKKLNDKEVAQEAFKIFDAGGGPIEVVEQLGVGPDEAKSLYDKYINLKALDLSKPSVPLQLKKLEEKLDKGLDGWSLINSVVNALNQDTPKEEQVNTFSLIRLIYCASVILERLDLKV
jgi:hypothetical protein